MDAGELKEAFDGWRGDETGSAGGRDELYSATISDGAFSGLLILGRAWATYTDGNRATLPTLLCR